MDRLGAMATLLAVVENGSLSAASRKLGLPLTTVSRRIADLEAHLRTKLVVRTSRRLSLTGAGQSYVEACRRILDDVDEAERAAAGEYSAPRGELVVTAPIVFGRLHVLPIVLEFLAAHPDIDIRLVLADHVVNLHDGGIDLAVRIGDLPDSSLVASRVGVIGRVVCASPAYIAQRGVPASPEDLAGHDCITFDGLSQPTSWSFMVHGARRAFAVRSRLVVNTAEAAVDAAVASVGLTRVLSYQAAQAVKAGELVLALREFEPAPVPVSFVHVGDRRLPLKLRVFRDFAGPRLKARLAAVQI